MTSDMILIPVYNIYLQYFFYLFNSQSMYHLLENYFIAGLILLTTQIFVRFLDYVMRNAAVSSSSITKSHLIISWPAWKSILSLGFLRCVSLGWVAPSSLLKLNKSSYKSMMTLIRSCNKWTLYYFGIKICFIWGYLFDLLLSEVLAKLLTDWCYRQAKSVLIYNKIILH